MYELRMPHVGPKANMGLIVCTEYKWVGLSDTHVSRWNTEKELNRDLKTLMNDPQFKKSEFMDILKYGIQHEV